MRNRMKDRPRVFVRPDCTESCRLLSKRQSKERPPPFSKPLSLAWLALSLCLVYINKKYMTKLSYIITSSLAKRFISFSFGNIKDVSKADRSVRNMSLFRTPLSAQNPIDRIGQRGLFTSPHYWQKNNTPSKK